jgi:hypothetical protein
MIMGFGLDDLGFIDAFFTICLNQNKLNDYLRLAPF